MGYFGDYYYSEPTKFVGKPVESFSNLAGAIAEKYQRNLDTTLQNDLIMSNTKVRDTFQEDVNKVMGEIRDDIKSIPEAGLQYADAKIKNNIVKWHTNKYVKEGQLDLQRELAANEALSKNDKISTDIKNKAATINKIVNANKPEFDDISGHLKNPYSAVNAPQDTDVMEYLNKMVISKMRELKDKSESDLSNMGLGKDEIGFLKSTTVESITPDKLMHIAQLILPRNNALNEIIDFNNKYDIVTARANRLTPKGSPLKYDGLVGIEAFDNYITNDELGNNIINKVVNTINPKTNRINGITLVPVTTDFLDDNGDIKTDDISQAKAKQFLLDNKKKIVYNDYANSLSGYSSYSITKDTKEDWLYRKMYDKREENKDYMFQNVLQRSVNGTGLNTPESMKAAIDGSQARIDNIGKTAFGKYFTDASGKSALYSPHVQGVLVLAAKGKLTPETAINSIKMSKVSDEEKFEAQLIINDIVDTRKAKVEYEKIDNAAKTKALLDNGIRNKTWEQYLKDKKIDASLVNTYNSGYQYGKTGEPSSFKTTPIKDKVLDSYRANLAKAAEGEMTTLFTNSLPHKPAINESIYQNFRENLNFKTSNQIVVNSHTGKQVTDSDELKTNLDLNDSNLQWFPGTDGHIKLSGLTGTKKDGKVTINGRYEIDAPVGTLQYILDQFAISRGSVLVTQVLTTLENSKKGGEVIVPVGNTGQVGIPVKYDAVDKKYIVETQEGTVKYNTLDQVSSYISVIEQRVLNAGK